MLLFVILCCITGWIHLKKRKRQEYINEYEFKMVSYNWLGARNL